MYMAECVLLPQPQFGDSRPTYSFDINGLVVVLLFPHPSQVEVITFKNGYFFSHKSNGISGYIMCTKSRIVRGLIGQYIIWPEFCLRFESIRSMSILVLMSTTY